MGASACRSARDRASSGHEHRLRAGIAWPHVGQACSSRHDAATRLTRTTVASQVTLIPGDGIGPSITAATVRVLEAVGADIQWDVQVAGMAAVAKYGDPIPDSTLDSI